MPEDKKKIFEEKLNILLELTEAENEEYESSKNKSENEKIIFFSPNSAYPSLSSSITIKYEKDRGRFGIANKDIKPGETLVFESPTGAKLRREFKKDHCENCLRYIILQSIYTYINTIVCNRN